MATVDAQRDDPFVILVLIGPKSLHPDETDLGPAKKMLYVYLRGCLCREDSVLKSVLSCIM